MSGLGAGFSLSDGWDLSGLTLAELWLRYLAVGGTASRARVEAYARGLLRPDSESTGILLASHAALAMAADRTQAGLLTAMDSREMIGQAKGILMERYKITGVEAFGLLVASSQAVNRKLRDVAEHLVATGELLTPSR